MRRSTIDFRLGPLVCWIVGTVLTGCVAFEPAAQSKVEDLNERPHVAILPFGFDLEITQLSAVKTVDGTLSSDDESRQLADALREIQQEARWLLLSGSPRARGFGLSRQSRPTPWLRSSGSNRVCSQMPSSLRSSAGA